MSSWAVNVRSGSTIARLPCNQRGSIGLSQGLFTGSRHTTIRTPPVRFTVRLCAPIHARTARLTCQAALSHTSTHTRLPSAASRSAPQARNAVVTPPYNLARLSFEWSAVVARESLSRSLWNTGSLAQLRQHPPPGPRTGTGGDADGPIDARTDRGGADLLREHEAQPAVLGRDIRPDRPHHPQGHQSRRQSRARGHHPASRKGED